MKPSFISKAIITALLSLGLVVSTAGCGNSETGSDTNTVTSNITSESSVEESKTPESSSEESKTPESSTEESKTSESSVEEISAPESSAEESSKAETSRVLFDTKKDLQLTTLSVNETTYDKNVFNSKFKSFEKLKIITAFMFSPKFYGINNGKPSIKLADGSTSSSRYTSVMSRVKKNEDDDFSAYVIEIICDSELKPSDFCFSFSFRDEKHQVVLSDGITPLSEDYIFNGTDAAQIHTIVSLDDRPYYLSGYTHGSTEFGSKDGYKFESSLKPLSIIQVTPDGTTKIDLSKLSFECDKEDFEGMDTSKVIVTFDEGKPAINDGYLSQVININFEIRYDKNADNATIDELKKIMSKMVSDGYLLYTGDNGKKVKIHL